jgi:beta-glucanase (GH16 family)
MPAPASAPVLASLVASFAPDGAPILALPNGFTPIVNYSNLVKDYEFDSSSLPADWSASANNSHGAHATMYQPSQVTMTATSVALTATPQASDGFPYTSGYISTEGNYAFNYGLIDFRAKMPGGPGLWSGLWLDQADASNPWGEIDVQEMLLGDLHTVYASAHAWAPSQWGETQSTVMTADATQAYHDYQLAWQPGLLTWAIDGIAYAQYSEAQAIAHGYPWVFDDGTGFYIIASLTVGAADEWPGAPNASTPWPATMQIQTIKLWQ